MANYDDNREERDDLDRTLDAVLAKYASVEPREGLEERILANLRSQGTRAAESTWWNWRFVAALATVLVIATVVVWRWNKPALPPVATHPQALKQAPVAPEVAHGDENNATPRKSKRHPILRHQREHEILAAGPKLDVFPTPLPLSEQEEILATYVARYPEHAALVAVARMDSLRQEAEERRRIASERDERQ
jgi:hypothetical protein